MSASRLFPPAFLCSVFFGCCVVAVLQQPVLGQVTRAENRPTPQTERISFQRTALPMIPPGTRFTEQPPPGWSHLISFARGKLASGDVDSVSDIVRYYSELFNLVLLANADQNDDSKFELDKVAVGFSMQIQGINTIVTAATQADLGGKLSLIGRSVLAGNLDSLKNVEQVARTRNSIVIDAPAIILRDGEHREMVVRYYIWVYPANGNMGTLVWLLESSPTGSQLRVADPTIQLLPANMQEDRVIHVDAEKFNLLGIPSKDAFALLEIPQGVAFEMNGKMQSLAAEKNYTPATLAGLTAAVAESLKAGKK